MNHAHIGNLVFERQDGESIEAFAHARERRLSLQALTASSAACDR